MPLLTSESKLSQAIEANTRHIRDIMPIMRDDLGSLRQDLDLTQLDAFKSWISQNNFVSQQSDTFRTRHEGTGQWFLERPEYVKWLEPSSVDKTLLCTGIPGAGKTVLAAVAIDHLSRNVRSSTIGVAWLYCSYKTRLQQNTDFLLEAILQQLVQAENPRVVTLAKNLYKQHKTRETRPSRNEVLNTLQAVLAELTTVYIVVDALDECSTEDNTRDHLLTQLGQLQEIADMRLLFTSRKIPGIVDKVGDALKIEVRAHDEDIRCYLGGQLHRLPDCVQKDAGLNTMIQEKLVEVINGMCVLPRSDAQYQRRAYAKLGSCLLDSTSTR
jgi:Cdc6-like AAA superfamily ATPase